jgi:hypothetical protein
MRRVVTALIVCGLATACSSGGSSEHGTRATTPNSGTACGLIAKLDTISGGIAHADVSDPDAFQQTLNTAVTEYADTLRQLAPLVPAATRTDVERVEASVKQYRFEEAQSERASIDTYAQTNCGRVPASLPTSVTTTAG